MVSKENEGRKSTRNVVGNKRRKVDKKTFQEITKKNPDWKQHPYRTVEEKDAMTRNSTRCGYAVRTGILDRVCLICVSFSRHGEDFF